MNRSSIEATAIPASTSVSIEPTVEPNKSSSPVNQEVWYDIEYGCYVPEDRLLPFKKDDLASVVAQDNHPSLRLSQDTSSPHSNRNTQYTAEEPRPDMLLQPTNKGSRHDCEEGVSELENDMLLAFERQENLSSAYPPKSTRSHHPGSELANLQVDQEPDQSGLEGLRHTSPLRIHPQEADAIPMSPDQQPQEKEVDEARAVEDDSGKSGQAEPAGKRPHREETERGRIGKRRTRKTRTKSPGLQNGESEIRSLPAKLRYLSNSTFRQCPEVPP